MSTFGLVHGGGFGAWCWERLIPELEGLGHHAATVDLTAEDQKVGAAHCAALLAEAFRSIDDLVLVGHSLAGLVTPLVVGARPMNRLVFIHALLPSPGYSVADQLRNEPDMFNPDLFAIQAPFWEDEEVANHFLFHDCANEVAHDAFCRLRPEPGVLGREVTPLRTWPEVPCAHIVCNEDRIATPGWARRAAQERLGVEPREISSGHCPFLSDPHQLAEVLVQCS